MDPTLPKLTQAYEALDLPARQVVEVLSAVLTPVTRNALLGYLNGAGCRGPGGATWSHPKLSAQIAKLISAGLVTAADKQISCAPAMCEVVLRRAAREGRLQKVAVPLRKALERDLA